MKRILFQLLFSWLLLNPHTASALEPDATARVLPAARGERGDGPARCFFAREQRRAELTTRAGVRVELYGELLLVDGAEVSPCSGLPREHPTSITGLGDGFAVAFREGGIWSFDQGRWLELTGVPKGPVRALATLADTLWIGVQDGLSGWRAGTSFTVAGLKHRGVSALYAEGEHTLHIGTDPSGWWTLSDSGALNLKSRREIVGCFRQTISRLEARAHPDACSDGPEHGSLPSAHVTALARYRGELVVGTFSAGAFVLRPEAAPRPLAGPRFVNALAVSGDALFIASTSGLFLVDASGASAKVPLRSPEPHVNGLFSAPDGTLWVATSDGLAGLSAAGLRWFDERNGLPARIVYAAAQTEDGALWAATAGGVARLGKDGVMRFTTESDQLPQNWVTALLPDGDAVLAGTYSAGIVRLAPGRQSQPLTAVASVWVNPAGLVRVERDVWIATLGDGLLREDGKRPLARLPSNDVTAILRDAGSLWIGTRGGLLRSSTAP